MKWFLKCLNQYGDFRGRARRTEYWMFSLFSIIFSILASIIDIIVFGVGLEEWGPIDTIYTLALFIPSIAVSVRRLHDIGKSGWMMLLILIPIIGWIWLFVLSVTDSDSGENQYGPNPKEPNDLEQIKPAHNMV